MSRIGKKPITIPEKTEVTLNGDTLMVKGPKGELSKVFKPIVAIKIEGGEVVLTPTEETLETNALWGTYASHVFNMVKGVNTGFEEKLIIEGIGYRAEVAGDTITMALGFSHPIKLKTPEGIKAIVEKGVMTLTGIDKEKLSQFAANIRSYKKPEPYKGKGIRYEKEKVRRKQGKKSV